MSVDVGDPGVPDEMIDVELACVVPNVGVVDDAALEDEAVVDDEAAQVTAVSAVVLT